MIFFIFLLISPEIQGFQRNLDSFISSSKIILGNVEFDAKSLDFQASRDLYRKDLIFSIPLNNTLHPLEDYAFKEFFNFSSKDTLIGRLIIEKLLSNESSLFAWLDSLKKPEEMLDLYHFSEKDLEDFQKRSFEDFSYLKVRKEKYLKIRKNLPVSLLNEQSLNYDIYNWASSIVDSSACVYELDPYDNSRLGLIRLNNPNTLVSSNLLIIPLLEKLEIIGWENSKPGVFNEDFEENPQLFRYISQKGDRLEIRAQKLIEKGKKPCISDSKSNREYLQYNGLLVSEELSRDFLLKIKPDFDMERIRLSWDLSVSPKKSLVFSFNLNAKALNLNLAIYSKIALLEERESYEEEKREILRKLEEEGPNKQKTEVFLVYWKVLLMKWAEFSKEKTSLSEDLKEIRGILDEKRRLGLEFAINAKKVFLRNLIMVQRKILKEIKRDFLTMNSRF